MYILYIYIIIYTKIKGVNSRTHNPEDEGREAITQPHGATTQNIHFLSTKTGLRLIKSSALCYLQCVKRQYCGYTSCLFLYSILSDSLSLVTQATRGVAVNIIALLTFKFTHWRTLHTAFSVSLSHTHTRTLQAARLAANTPLP